METNRPSTPTVIRCMKGQKASWAFYPLVFGGAGLICSFAFLPEGPVRNWAPYLSPLIILGILYGILGPIFKSYFLRMDESGIRLSSSGLNLKSIADFYGPIFKKMLTLGLLTSSSLQKLAGTIEENLNATDAREGTRTILPSTPWREIGVTTVSWSASTAGNMGTAVLFDFPDRPEVSFGLYGRFLHSTDTRSSFRTATTYGILKPEIQDAFLDALKRFKNVVWTDLRDSASSPMTLEVFNNRNQNVTLFVGLAVGIMGMAALANLYPFLCDLLPREIAGGLMIGLEAVLMLTGVILLVRFMNRSKQTHIGDIRIAGGRISYVADPGTTQFDTLIREVRARPINLIHGNYRGSYLTRTPGLVLEIPGRMELFLKSQGSSAPWVDPPETLPTPRSPILQMSGFDFESLVKALGLDRLPRE